MPIVPNFLSVVNNRLLFEATTEGVGSPFTIQGTTGSKSFEKRLNDDTKVLEKFRAAYFSNDKYANKDDEFLELQSKYLSDASEAAQDYGSNIRKTGGSVEAFVQEQREANKASTKFKGTMTNLKSSVVGFGKSLLSGLASGLAMGAALALIDVGVNAVVAKVQERQKSIESAIEASKAYKTEDENIQSQIAQYETLTEKIREGNLTEEETASVKQELLGLQQNINSTYGDQVQGVNLVNGSYERQLELLKKIQQENSREYIRENREGNKANKEDIEAERTYNRGSTVYRGENADDVDDLISKFEEFSKTRKNSTGTAFRQGTNPQFNIIPQGTYEEAAAEYDAYIEFFENYAKENSVDLTDLLIGFENKKKSTLPDNFEEMLQTQKDTAYAEIMVDDILQDKFYDAEKAVEDYNDALLKGDTDKIEEAATKFGEVKSEIDKLDLPSAQKNVFNDMFKNLNQYEASKYQFDKVVKNSSDNGLSTPLKSIKESGYGITELMADMDDTSSVSNAESAFMNLADAMVEMGVISDTSQGSLENLASWLEEIRILTSVAENGVDSYSQKLTGMKATTSNVIDAQDSLTGILGQQSSTLGITSEAYDALISSDQQYGECLEYVNGQMVINEKKARSLANAKLEEAKANAEVEKAQAQLAYGDKISEMFSLEGTTEEIAANASVLAGEATELRNVVQGYDILIAQLNNAAGAYQGWLNAKSGGESGDYYDEGENALKSLKDVFDSDSDDYLKVGTDKFKAAAELMLGDISNLDTDEIQAKIKKVSKYYEEGAEGIGNFQEDLLDKGILKEAEDGFDISDGWTMESIASELGITTDLVRMLFGEFEEYGTKLDFSDEIDGMDTYGQKVSDAADNLLSLNDQYQNLSESDKTGEKGEQLKQDIESAKDTLDAARDMSTIDLYFQASPDSAQGALESLQTSINNGTITIQQVEVAQDALENEKQELEAKLKVEGISSDEKAALEAQLGEVKLKLSVLGGITSEDQSKIDNAKKTSDELNASIAKPKKVVVEASQATSTLTAVSSALRAIQSKEIAITVTRTTHEKTVKDGELNGNAQFGNAHAYGTIGADQGHVALTGELGKEIIVDPNTGKWKTVGDNGAEFAYIPKGAIVFNHQQTQSLLQNGYVAGRGKQSGYAHVTGWLPDLTSQSSSNKGSSSSSKKPSSSSKSSSRKKTSSSSKSSSSIEKAFKSFEKFFDWCEFRLDSIAKKTQKAIDLIKKYVSFASQNKQVDKAIKATTDEIKQNQAAYKKYMEQASKVASKTGMSRDMVDRIKNGRIHIDNYSENTKKKIQEYKEWYDRAQDCLDTVTELKEQQKELALQKMENIENYYDNRTGYKDTYDSYRQSVTGYYDTSGKTVSQSYLQGSIDNLAGTKKSTGKLQYLEDEKKNLNKQFDSLVKSKTMSQYSDEWYEWKNKIRDVEAEIYDTKSAIEEYQQQIYQLKLSPIDNQIEAFQQLNDKLEQQIDFMETYGKTVSSSLYNSMISNSAKEITAQENKRKNIQSEMNRVLKNGGSKNSEYYQGLLSDLNDCNSSIQDLKVSQEEWNQAIHELKIDSIDNQIESLESANNKIKEQMDLFEAMGKSITPEMYEDFIKLGDDQITAEKAKLSAIQAEMNRVLKNGGDKGSSYYQGLLSEYRDCESAINDITLSQYEWDKAVYELSVDKIDQLLDKYKTIQSQLEDMMKLHETQGYDLTSTEYLELIAKGYEQIIALQDQVAVHQARMDQILANGGDTSSKEYLEAKEALDDCLSSILDNKIAQEEWNDAILDLQIDALKKQKEELEKVNSELDHQIRLEKAIDALARARSQKNKLVYRQGVGFVYEADQDAIKEAQEALNDVYYDDILKKFDDAIDAIEDLKDDNNLYDYNGNKQDGKDVSNEVNDIVDSVKDAMDDFENKEPKGKSIFSGNPDLAKLYSAVQNGFGATGLLNGIAPTGQATASKNISNVNTNQSVNVSIGDVYVQEVKNPFDLAQDIVKQLPNAVTQTIYKHQ